MRIKIFLTIILTAFLGFSGFSQNEQYEKEVEAIFNAFKTKDYQILKPMLSPKVTIGPFPQGQNDALIPYILNQLPGPVSYKMGDVVKEENGTRVYSVFSYERSAPRRLSFLFNKEKIITDFDILEGIELKDANAFTPSHQPLRFETEFSLVNNLIILKAKLNGEEVRFVFDNGSAQFALNSDFFDEELPTNTDGLAFGVGGTVNVKDYHIDSFDWNGLKVENFNAMAIPLGSVSKETGVKIAGLIGYEVYKDYQITFDYVNKKLIFELTDKNGTVLSDSSQSQLLTGYEIIPLEMKQQNPVFTVMIGDKAYRMALDCGAASGLMYAKFVPELEDHIKHKSEGSAGGAGDGRTRSLYAVIDNFKVGSVEYKNMPFFFNDQMLAGVDYGVGEELSGLLGFQFLNEYKTIINYNKREMYIYTGSSKNNEK